MATSGRGKPSLLDSFVDTTKELVTFLTGASFANLLYQLVQAGSPGGPIKLNVITWQSWVLFSALLILISRFFYGNIKYINCNFMNAPSSFTGKLVSIFDVSNIVIDSLLLGFASFYVNHPKNYSLLISILFGFEVAWFVTTTLLEFSEDQQITRRLLFWQLNNLLAFLALLITLLKANNETLIVVVFATVIFINTILDVWVGKDFYFRAGVEPNESGNNPGDADLGLPRSDDRPAPRPSAGAA